MYNLFWILMLLSASIAHCQEVATPAQDSSPYGLILAGLTLILGAVVAFWKAIKIPFQVAWEQIKKGWGMVRDGWSKRKGGPTDEQ